MFLAEYSHGCIIVYSAFLIATLLNFGQMTVITILRGREREGGEIDSILQHRQYRSDVQQQIRPSISGN